MRGRNEDKGRVSRVIYSKGLASFVFVDDVHPFFLREAPKEDFPSPAPATGPEANPNPAVKGAAK